MIQLISDSTSDLSPELRQKYHIDILPLNVMLDDQTHTDGVDITPEEIFAWSDATRKTPKTGTFSVDAAKKKFRSYLDQGDELICFAISEKMSASAQVMRLAAQALHAEDKIHIIDSENLSTGIGLLILEAADRISAGMPAVQIVREIEALRPYVRASFVVDTLTYLHRGGRCNGVAAFLGNTLRLHPEIVVENGGMHPARKYRGGMHQVLKEYAHDLLPAMEKSLGHRIFITYSSCKPEVAQELRSYLESLGLFEEVLETQAGSVVSSHCGPNTLGILFIAQPES